MDSPNSIIKALRKAKKISQKRMADRLGCNLKTYQRFENGKNERRDMLQDACQELGLTLLVVDKADIIKDGEVTMIIKSKTHGK